MAIIYLMLSIVIALQILQIIKPLLLLKQERKNRLKRQERNRKFIDSKEISPISSDIENIFTGLL